MNKKNKTGFFTLNPPEPKKPESTISEAQKLKREAMKALEIKKEAMKLGKDLGEVWDE